MSLCLHFFFFFLSLSFFLFFLRFYYFCIFALSKGPKWPNTINSWNILPKNTVLEQYSDLPLFVVLELGELEYHIFNPTWPDDMESLIKKKKIGHLVLELGGLEYCSWYPSPSSSSTILGRLLFPCVQSFPFSFTVLACFCLIFGYLNSSSLIGVEIIFLFNFHL